MESASLRYGPAMASGGPFSLSHYFERHLRAKDLSDGTVASYLVGVRQFTAFLQPHGRQPNEATPRRPRGIHRQPARPLVAGDRRHPLPAAPGAVPLAGGRGRDCLVAAPPRRRGDRVLSQGQRLVERLVGLATMPLS